MRLHALGVTIGGLLLGTALPDVEVLHTDGSEFCPRGPGACCWKLEATCYKEQELCQGFLTLCQALEEQGSQRFPSAKSN